MTRLQALQGGRRSSRASAAGAVALVCACFGLAGQSIAEEEELIEEIVVTASATHQKLSTLTSAVSVIDAAEIEFSRYDNVTELLRQLPGVHLEQPGGRGSPSSIYMRGLDPNHIAILVDGVRLNDPNNQLGGAFNLSTLDTDNVERIEVVRGPLSAVHGSDALAGAINVITKSGKGPDELIVDGSGGRWGYHRGLAIVRGERGIVDLSLSGSYVDDGEPESENRFRSGDVNARIGVRLPNHAYLRATARFVNSRSRAFPDGSGGHRAALIRSRDRRRAKELSLGLAYEQALTDWFDYTGGVSYYRRREKRVSPGVAFAVPATEANDLLYRTTLNLNGTVHIGEGLRLTAGGDVYFESGNSISFTDAFPPFLPATPGSYHDDRVVGGPFIEGLYEAPIGLVVQAGVRADFPDDNSTEWTPRVGASYLIPYTPLKVRGSWGEGFKLPAFFSLSAPGGVGNDKLDAEESMGWDIGVEATLWGERIHASATYFDLRVKDLIDFDFTTFSLVNRDEVTSRGVELAIHAALPWNLYFSGALTSTRTNIRKTSEDLRRRPRWRASGGLQWQAHERVALGLNALWVGSTWDESAATGKKKLDDYVRFDFRGDVRLLRDITVYLAVDNLFDNDYEEAVGVPATGARLRAGVRARF